MNLWVKRTGQLLLAVLFLMSCEDETYLLGFINKSKFNVGYQEFTIALDEGIPTGKTISVDSVITDNFSGITRLLVGEYNDPELGTVRTEAYTEFLPSITTKLASSTTLEYYYDSITFQTRLDYYSYGLSDVGQSDFTIHRIIEDTLSYIRPSDNDPTKLVFNRYFASSTVGYDAEVLGATNGITTLKRKKGEDTFIKGTLKYSTLKAAKDTLLAVARLSDAFGEELYNVALNDLNSEFSNRKKFRSRFKGIVLVPSASNAVVGHVLSSGYSRIRLHYHTTEAGVYKDTLFRDFFFSLGASFNNINASRPANYPASESPFVATTPDKLAVQSGDLMITKIDLEPFYRDFADTVDAKKIVLNSAEIVIESEGSSDAYAPIQYFDIRPFKENDRYFDYRINEDSIAMIGYQVLSDRQYYFAGSDVSSAASVLSYNSSNSKYTGTATLFFQSLIKNKDRVDTPRVRYLGIYPANPSVTGITSVPTTGKYINRTLFSNNKVKLRIYYTIPNNPNL
jgi:hypothetical protein